MRDDRRELVVQTVADLCRRIGCDTPALEWADPNGPLVLPSAKAWHRTRFSWRQPRGIGVLSVKPALLTASDTTIRHELAKALQSASPRYRRTKLNCIVAAMSISALAPTAALHGEFSHAAFWVLSLIAVAGLMAALEDSTLFAIGVTGEIQPAIDSLAESAQNAMLGGANPDKTERQLAKSVANLRRSAIDRGYISAFDAVFVLPTPPEEVEVV